MGVPPLVGADHDTARLAFPGATVGFAGAAGGDAGMTTVDGADAGDVPTPLCAFTVKVYVVPFFNVATVQLSVVSEVGPQVFVPGEEVTMYAVIGVPFVVADAAHDTRALLLPRTAFGFPGAVGVPAATAVDAAEGSDVPVPL